MCFCRPVFEAQHWKSPEHPHRHFVLATEAAPLCRKRDVTRPGERCLHNLSYHIVLLTLYWWSFDGAQTPLHITLSLSLQMQLQWNSSNYRHRWAVLEVTSNSIFISEKLIMKSYRCQGFPLHHAIIIWGNCKPHTICKARCISLVFSHVFRCHCFTLLIYLD